MAEETSTPDEAAAAAAAAQATADKAAADAAAAAEAKAAEADAADETKDDAGEEAEVKDGEDGAEGEDGEEAGDAEGAESEEEEQKVELDTSVWGSTGSETGDAVLQVLQDSGADPQEAKALLFDAIQAGDVTQIDEGKLTEMLGAAQAKIVLMGAKNFIAEANAKNTAIVETMHKSVGGEDNWKKVAAWAEQSVPEDEMNDYRDLINAGGAKARFAATQLLEAYNGDTKNSSISAPRVEAPANTPPPKVEGITRRQYVEALEKANKAKAGADVIAKIKAQRAAGRKQGI